jgi:peptidoglycan-associated lipoprotein
VLNSKPVIVLHRRYLKVLNVLFGITAAAVISTSGVRDAASCGLKLTVQATKGKKAVAPSQNPSRVLLLGEPPSKLDRALAQAGHTVQVADDPAAEKGKDYQIVLVEDPGKIKDAEKAWPKAKVMAMAKNTGQNIALVEDSLARQPTGAKTTAVAVAVKEERQPVAVGPEDRAATGGKAVVAAGQGDPTAPRAADRAPVAGGSVDTRPAPAAPPPAPKPEPAPVAKAEPPPPPPAPVVKPEPKPEPAPVAKAEPPPPKPVKSEPTPVAMAARQPEPKPEPKAEPVREVAPKAAPELYFALGSSELQDGVKKALAGHAKWLKANPSSKLTIEGHTDAIGPSEYNLSLGERRANSAKKYLVAIGADASRVEVVSYGEERPSHDPPENPRNRRVVVVRE